MFGVLLVRGPDGKVGWQGLLWPAPGRMGGPGLFVPPLFHPAMRQRIEPTADVLVKRLGSELEMLIVGDRLYGTPGPRLMLHAESIRFRHPDGSELELTARAPF